MNIRGMHGGIESSREGYPTYFAGLQFVICGLLQKEHPLIKKFCILAWYRGTLRYCKRTAMQTYLPLLIVLFYFSFFQSLVLFPLWLSPSHIYGGYNWQVLHAYWHGKGTGRAETCFEDFEAVGSDFWKLQDADFQSLNYVLCSKGPNNI